MLNYCGKISVSVRNFITWVEKTLSDCDVGRWELGGFLPLTFPAKIPKGPEQSSHIPVGSSGAQKGRKCQGKGSTGAAS